MVSAALRKRISVLKGRLLNARKHHRMLFRRLSGTFCTFESYRWYTSSLILLCMQWMRRLAGWTYHLVVQLMFVKQDLVPLKTTGHEKDHSTVILTAHADGKKLKPFIVFKGKGTRLIKDLQKIQGVVVRLSGNGWMNDKLRASLSTQLAFLQETFARLGCLQRPYQ